MTTEVLGSMRTMQWFTGLSALDVRQRGVAEGCFLPGWQGRFSPQTGLELWHDRYFPGWDGVFRSPNLLPPEAITRVIFEVSGSPRPHSEWIRDIRRTLSVLYSRYPAAHRILLQPAPAAGDRGKRPPGLESNQAAIAAAIEAVCAVESSGYCLGARFKLDHAAHVFDGTGQLSSAGAQFLHHQMRGLFMADGVPTA